MINKQTPLSRREPPKASGGSSRQISRSRSLHSPPLGGKGRGACTSAPRPRRSPPARAAPHPLPPSAAGGLQRTRLEHAEGMADEERPEGDEDLARGEALAREEVAHVARRADHAAHGVARTSLALATFASAAERRRLLCDAGARLLARRHHHDRLGRHARLRNRDGRRGGRREGMRRPEEGDDDEEDGPHCAISEAQSQIP
eukprot:CAMPEP_0118817634 /NCGR_PEP_ID=MMETSP1162-20130426/5526_1 /TAXON_ID=33656 /ORGANISM="Phaeocystis Sp, Strain CCMP2710" /LENGTH=201 /DNA_ID=CAMNT_0006747743 /DNA_START=71 /DNA_END=672 /DNA_ORIENTATION=-